MRERFFLLLPRKILLSSHPLQSCWGREYSQILPNAPPSSQYKENEHARPGGKRDKIFKDALFPNLGTNRTIYGGKGTFVTILPRGSTGRNHAILY